MPLPPWPTRSFAGVRLAQEDAHFSPINEHRHVAGLQQLFKSGYSRGYGGVVLQQIPEAPQESEAGNHSQTESGDCGIASRVDQTSPHGYAFPFTAR